MDKLDI